MITRFRVLMVVLLLSPVPASVAQFWQPECQDCPDGQCQLDVNVPDDSPVMAAICRLSVGGTGALVDVNDKGQGIVLTATHLFDFSKQTTTYASFPDGQRCTGRLAAFNREWDIAAVVIDAPTGIRPIAVAIKPALLGDSVWYAGYGQATVYVRTAGFHRFDGKVTGYVNMKMTSNGPRVTRGKQSQALTLLFSRTSRPGDSGAPILNADDELVAILSARRDERNETLGTYCGKINSLGWEWCADKLLPWNATTEQATIQRETQREQALIGLAERAKVPQMAPMTLPGPSVTPLYVSDYVSDMVIPLKERIIVLEVEVAAGRELVGRLGLLEASDETVESVVATLGTSVNAAAGRIEALEMATRIDVEKVKSVAEELKVSFNDAVSDADKKAAALAAEVGVAVAEVKGVKAEVEAQAEQQETTDGWINVLLGMAGTALAGLVPGGGVALWALKRSGAADKLKDRVEDVSSSVIDRLESRLDRLTDRIPGKADDALKDKLLAALKEAL